MISPKVIFSSLFQDLKSMIRDFSFVTFNMTLKNELENFKIRDFLFASALVFSFISFVLTFTGVGSSIYYFQYFQLLFLFFIALSSIKFGPIGGFLSSISIATLHLIFMLMNLQELAPPLNGFAYNGLIITVYIVTGLGLTTALYGNKGRKIAESVEEDPFAQLNASVDMGLSEDLMKIMGDGIQENTASEDNSSQASAQVVMQSVNTLNVEDFLKATDADFSTEVKQRMMRQSHFLTVMQKVATAALSARSDQHFFESLAKVLSNDFRASKLAIIKFDEKTKSFFIAANAGLEREQASSFRLPMGKGLIGSAISKQEPWSVATDMLGKSAMSNLMRDNQIPTLALIPVFYNNQLFAAINICEMKNSSFTDEDYRFLMKLTEIVRSSAEFFSKKPALQREGNLPQAQMADGLDDGDFLITVEEDDDNEYI